MLNEQQIIAIYFGGACQIYAQPDCGRSSLLGEAQIANLTRFEKAVVNLTRFHSIENMGGDDRAPYHLIFNGLFTIVEFNFILFTQRQRQDGNSI